MKMTDELDKQINILVDEWNKYHKNPREYSMPDMEKLSKLRAERDRLRRGNRWES